MLKAKASRTLIAVLEKAVLEEEVVTGSPLLIIGGAFFCPAECYIDEDVTNISNSNKFIGYDVWQRLPIQLRLLLLENGYSPLIEAVMSLK